MFSYFNPQQQFLMPTTQSATQEKQIETQKLCACNDCSFQFVDQYLGIRNSLQAFISNDGDKSVYAELDQWISEK